MAFTVEQLKEARDNGYTLNDVASHLGDAKLTEAAKNNYTIDDVIDHFKSQPTITQHAPIPRGTIQSQAQPTDNGSPIINALDQKLQGRVQDFNNTPLIAKPAAAVNALARGTGDVLQAGAESAVNLIPQGAQAAIGGVIDQPLHTLSRLLSGAVQQVGSLIPQQVGQTASDIIQGGKQIMNDHPVLSEYTKAAGNAAMMGLPVFEGTAKTLQGGLGGIAKVAQGYNKIAGKATEAASGVPEEALRMAGTQAGRDALKAAAGTEYEIGQNLVNKLDDAYTAIRTAPKAQEALQNLPVIDPKPIIDKLKASAGNPQLPELQKAAEQIKTTADRLQSVADKYYGYVPADELYNFRKEIDQVIGDNNFGQSSGKYISALKNARYDIKNALLDAAKGTDYESTMSDMATKLDAVDKMKAMLGKNATTQEGRAESFIRNINNMGKTQQREWLENFQNVFGGDFLSEAKNAGLAAKLGDNGEASLLPQHFTGKSLLGIGLGSVLHTPIVGVAASSPKIASRIILPITQGTEDLTTSLSDLANKIPSSNDIGQAIGNKGASIADALKSRPGNGLTAAGSGATLTGGMTIKEMMDKKKRNKK